VLFPLRGGASQVHREQEFRCLLDTCHSEKEDEGIVNRDSFRGGSKPYDGTGRYKKVDPWPLKNISFRFKTRNHYPQQMRIPSRSMSSDERQDIRLSHQSADPAVVILCKINPRIAGKFRNNGYEFTPTWVRAANVHQACPSRILEPIHTTEGIFIVQPSMSETRVTEAFLLRPSGARWGPLFRYRQATRTSLEPVLWQGYTLTVPSHDTVRSLCRAFLRNGAQDMICAAAL
jgi:hypothetical protein